MCQDQLLFIIMYKKPTEIQRDISQDIFATWANFVLEPSVQQILHIIFMYSVLL